MIYTFTTKQAQLRNGFYKTGTGPQTVLILGSCRAMPYLNYLARWNDAHNPYTIHYINPFDWNWNERDEQVNLEEAIDRLETDPRILGVLKSADIFIHEHFGNYGMFNTSREAPKNIYQFGMDAEHDISVPNFHDHFILYNDFVNVGQQPPENYAELGEAAVDKFCALCDLTDFPEMSDCFRSNWRKTRLFWTPNHVSAAFSIFIFRSMNCRFLHLPLDNDFWQQALGEDMFRDPHTQVHAKDIEAYGLEWS